MAIVGMRDVSWGFGGLPLLDNITLQIEKGDRICIYMPMIPEAAFAMLACARIGAIHSIVFAGFSPDALAARVTGSEASLVITAEFCPLRGEGFAYVEKLRQADVETDHFHLEDMIHAFMNMEDLVKESCEAVYTRIGRFLDRP